MDDIHYIQEYYYYLIVFLCILTSISFFSYSGRRYWDVLVNFVSFLFAAFMVYYIGTRAMNIGVDTSSYQSIFKLYEYVNVFFIRKDPFYDFLNYIFARLFNFQALLLFCAFLYMFCAFYGFKKIFKQDFYLPFLVFLISPYFVNAGINVMRSGVAASLFLAGLGVYYTKGRNWKVVFWFLGSVLFHASMFVPLIFFLITRFIKNTKLIFSAWLGSIVLSVLQINIIASLVNVLEVISARAGSYVVPDSEESSWVNFFIFGFFPVAFAVYNIVVLKYKNDFYKWLINAYMLTHIPYIILINTQFASRLGYLAEFLMPVVLLFPLLIEPELKIKYSRLLLCLIIFFVFLLKAYKVLIV